MPKLNVKLYTLFACKLVYTHTLRCHTYYLLSPRKTFVYCTLKENWHSTKVYAGSGENFELSLLPDPAKMSVSAYLLSHHPGADILRGDIYLLPQLCHILQKCVHRLV